MTTRQFDELIDEIIDERNERSLIILCSSIIDEQLYNILDLYLMKPAKKKEDDLLKGDNPLATFSSRIKVIYRLGLIDNSFREILDNVRKVRNLCAHSVELKLNKAPIKDHISNLRKSIIGRETYTLTRKRYFEDKTDETNEVKSIFVTICVILEAIINTITEIDINTKTTKISLK